MRRTRDKQPAVRLHALAAYRLLKYIAFLSQFKNIKQLLLVKFLLVSVRQTSWVLDNTLEASKSVSN